VGHILTNPPADCYDKLKAAQLSNHQLTEIQKSELLFNMDILGARQPIDLLAEMLELVNQERSQLSFSPCYSSGSSLLPRAPSYPKMTTRICARWQRRPIESSLCWQNRSTTHTVAAVSTQSDDKLTSSNDLCVAAVRPPFRGGRNNKQWPKQQGKKRSQPSSNC